MGEVEGIFFDEMHFSPLFHLGLLWATFSVIGHRAQPMDLKIKVHPVESTQPTVLGPELGFRAGYRSGYDSEDSDNSASKADGPDGYRSGSEQKEDRYGEKDCYQPAVTGRCKARIINWFYNHKSGRCETFTYGGCGGNGNNFRTEESCKRTCGNKKDSSQPEVHRGVDCVWNKWGDWSSCTQTCDEGFTWRFRTIKHQTRFGGKPCQASVISDYTETKSCNEQPCNSDESTPKGGNGSGHGYGSKGSVDSEASGDMRGPGYGSKEDSSQPEVHKGVDCVWAQWGDWSSCTRACDEDIIWRFRTIKHQKRFGGKQCKASAISDYTETKPCNEQPCRSDEKEIKSGENGSRPGYGSKESDEPESDEPKSDEEK